MPFKISYTDLVQKSAKEAIDIVNRARKKQLGDLRIYDLMFDKSEPIFHGVYLFYSNENQCLYTGKNSSQSFVERIPWHFALSEKAWMNHFLKYRREAKKLNTIPETAIEAQDCQLLLIPIPGECWLQSKQLEKFFRLFLLPKYNVYSERYRNCYSHIDLQAPLNNVLSDL